MVNNQLFREFEVYADRVKFITGHDPRDRGRNDLIVFSRYCFVRLVIREMGDVGNVNIGKFVYPNRPLAHDCIYHFRKKYTPPRKYTHMLALIDEDFSRIDIDELRERILRVDNLSEKEFEVVQLFRKLSVENKEHILQSIKVRRKIEIKQTLNGKT